MLRSRFTQSRVTLGLIIPGLIFTIGQFVSTGQGRAEQPVKEIGQLEQHIDKLIRQLGDDQYATREKAQAELARLNLAAFDALLGAQEHDDVEIALRARYLIRSMNIGWVREDDPAAVKSILRGYEAAEPDHRRTIMNRLSLEDGLVGTEALCRLARFETSEVLSKKAAIVVMRSDPPADETARREWIETIRNTIGPSRRTGAKWLNVFVATLENDDNALTRLQELSQKEQELFRATPDRSSPEIVGDLLLWQAKLLREAGKNQPAFDVIVRRLDVLKDSREVVVETLDWLINQQAWELIDEVSRRYESRYEEDGEFLYLLADARRKQGEKASAEALARRAFALVPDDTREHKRVGLVLQTRGLFDWAEREYRYVIGKGPVGTLAHVEGYLYLSEMLHDQLQDQEAAALLDELMKLSDDKTVREQIQRKRGSLDNVRSRMHLFYGQHFERQEEFAKSVEHFSQAADADPTDADVLISMYRAPKADKDFRKRTKELIDDSAGKFRQQIELFRRQYEEAHDEEFRDFAGARLALLYNQYAWLIGNTEGDYDEAVRFSHRSLELEPGSAGYLDTLGRCYYAAGDLESALKYQGLALKYDAHSGAIRRQYEFFERELAAQKQHRKS